MVMETGKTRMIVWSKVRKAAVWMTLAMILAVASACASSGKVRPQGGSKNQEPTVSRLEDGRQGFVIRETPSMDSESRSEFRSAVSMLEDGKSERAIEVLTKVIERSPGATAPYINIAVAYIRTGKLEEAEKNLKKALELVPDHPVAGNEYGLLLRKSGRFREARAIYEKTLSRFPDYLPVHRNLGILCDLYLNDPKCALKQFETYAEALPGDKEVKLWIAELRMRLKK